MPIFVSMLRGVNVGGHNKIKMEDLRSLCEGLKLTRVKTHLQSGNVIFQTSDRNPAALANKLQACIYRKCGFRPGIILRTIPEMREVIARNPFAKRKGIEPGKLAVVFLEQEPAAGARQALLQMDIAPEELHVVGSHLYDYFPNGQGRPRLSWAEAGKILSMVTTARNWNTVTKLLELAEQASQG